MSAGALLAEIEDGLVPALQARGLTRAAYAHTAVPRQSAGILTDRPSTTPKRVHPCHSATAILGRRHLLALGAAGAAASFWELSGARRTTRRCRRLPPIPEKLKGTGEVRIADYGGTVQDAQRTAYYEPFEKLSGIKVRDFAGADLNKVKAMVETGTVEWDVVQLSQGSVTNLTQARRLFREDRLRPGGHRQYRAGLSLPTMRWTCWCGRR